MEGAVLKMAEGWMFELDVPVRVTRGKPAVMTNLGWHAQHREATLCSYATSSYFVARAPHGYRYMGISIGERR